MTTYANIRAMGSARGSLSLTNADLVALIGHIQDKPDTGTSNEWIVKNVGIVERPIVSSEESVYSLAVDAAKDLYRKNGLSPEKLDHIIVATNSATNPFPPVACHVARALNVDVSGDDKVAGCCGFIYALQEAKALISDGAEEILVIGVEALSKLCDYSDRQNSILWGDQAGAFLIRKSNQPGLIDFLRGSDTWGLDFISLKEKRGKHLIYSSNSFTLSEPRNEPFIYMKGPDVFTWVAINPGILFKSIDEILKRNNLLLKDIDIILPHQANIRMIASAVRNYFVKNRASLEQQGLSKSDLISKTYVDSETMGNSSSASVPVSFEKAVETGKIKPGDRYLLPVFGSGLLWGVALGIWNP